MISVWPSPLWPGIFGALFALLAAWLLLRDPARARPRCRRCGYEMSSVPTTTCPECGTPHARPGDLHRRRLAWRRASLPLLGVLACLLVAMPRVLWWRLWYALPPTWTTMREQPMGACSLRWREARDPRAGTRRLELRDARGRLVAAVEGFDVFVGVPVFGSPRTAPPGLLLGDGTRDLTGDGVPDLILDGISGRVGRNVLVSLGPSPHVVTTTATITGDGWRLPENGGPVEFLAPRPPPTSP